MRYFQPYGVSDPDAPYVNGNPATGTMGSIPPAQSVEHPQRELVALIAAVGLTPDEGDLEQLLKSVKLADVMNVFKMGENLGNAAQWSMSCPALPIMPPPKGTTVWFKPGLASVPGGTLFSVNGSAFLPVVACDLSDIAVGDIMPTAWLLLYFDGAYWQVIAGSTRQFGSIPVLFANIDWYVNVATGDDTNYDGTQATHTSGKHGPFKTLQRAADEVVKYNQNGYNETVHVADGAYAPVSCKPTNGSGTVYFIGNQANPAACTITSNVTDTCAIFQNSGHYGFSGFRVSSVGSGVNDGFANNSGNTVLSNIQFGPCTRHHVSVAWNGYILMDGGNFTIEAGGNATTHLSANLNSQIAMSPFNPPVLKVLGSVTFGRYIDGNQLGVLQIFYASRVGNANVHGAQYTVTGNSVLNGLASGAMPGDVAGSLSYGGQYIP
jgi:hypothetical protein